MTITGRDKRAIVLLGIALAGILAWRWWDTRSTGAVAPVRTATVDAIQAAQRRLNRLRQTVATVPGKEEALKQARAELEAREKRMIVADTAPQAQAQLLQVIRRIGKAQSPPIDIRAAEIGQVRPLGQDYGEVVVTVVFDCRIEQLVNLLADLTKAPELIVSNELRVSSGNQKEKITNVRLTVASVVPRKLVPEKKGLASF